MLWYVDPNKGKQEDMCGRYTLRKSEIEIAAAGIIVTQKLTPRYNIAPTQKVPVCRMQAGNVEFADVQWGLVPSWSKDRKSNYGMINARGETVAHKPSFRAPFRNRRCLIPADGYYEWQNIDGRKQPHFIRLKNDSAFAFAGLWDLWVDENGSTALESCCIITIAANSMLKPVHDRMPVMLEQKYYDQWLDPDVKDADRLERLLRQHSKDDIEVYPVSFVVNSPNNDDGRCVVPMDKL